MPPYIVAMRAFIWQNRKVVTTKLNPNSANIVSNRPLSGHLGDQIRLVKKIDFISYANGYQYRSLDKDRSGYNDRES